MIQFKPGRWEGLEGLGEEELKRLRAPAEAAVSRAALFFEGEVKRTLGPDGGPRTGRTYKVSKTGPFHQASAPGEPPAVLYGKLRQSITHSEPKWEGWSVSCEVGTALSYARRMEWGGIDSRGVRILPRPYFEPTVLRTQDQIEAILEESIL